MQDIYPFPPVCAIFLFRNTVHTYSVLRIVPGAHGFRILLPPGYYVLTRLGVFYSRASVATTLYVVNNSHFLVNALRVRMYFTRYQVRVFVFCFHNFCFRNAEGACSQKPHLTWRAYTHKHTLYTKYSKAVRFFRKFLHMTSLMPRAEGNKWACGQ